MDLNDRQFDIDICNILKTINNSISRHEISIGLQKFSGQYLPSKHLPFNLPFHRHTKKMCEMFSKLTIKTPERRQQRSSVFIFNFKHISYIFLLYLLMTLNK